MIATLSPSPLSPPTHASGEAAQFIHATFEPDDLIELRLILPKPVANGRAPQQRWFRACDIGDHLAWARDLNSKGWGVYVGANPRKRSGGKAVDVAVCRSFFCDFDGVALRQARERCDEAGLPAPTCIVQTGHPDGGYQFWWRLDESLDDPRRWECVEAAIVAKVQSDPAVKDAPRVLRLPGFLNTKYESKPLATIVELEPDRTYPLDEFPEPLMKASPNGKTAGSGPVNAADRTKAIDCLSKLKPERADEYGSWVAVGMILHSTDVSASMLAEWDGWSQQSDEYEAGLCATKWATFSQDGAARLGTLIEWARKDASEEAACSAEQIIASAKEANQPNDLFIANHLETFARLPMGDWATAKREVKAAFGKQVNLNDLEKAVAQHRREAKREAVTRKYDDRPRVVVNDRPTSVITGEVVDALKAANDPPQLFVRSGALARVDSDENDRAIVREVDEQRLRHRVARACYCVLAGENGHRHLHPPRDVIGDILSLGSWPFPSLVGVVECPVLRPDGTVLERPGYDAATRLMYVPAPKLAVPEIPAQPSRDDARSALAVIEDVLADFPFVDQAARANAVAGMLTPIMRQYIRGCVPLEVIDAPAAGSGKTLLANAKALVATGRPAGLMTAPKGNEEMRKVITAALGEGTTVLNLDNLEHTLLHPALAAALTAEVWSDRKLGQSEMITLPQRATWIATGNNVRLGGDMPRRSYWVRLDAKVSRPWQRDGFRHADLLGWVGEHRGELLAALLTMARAWIVAGKPQGAVPTLGGFESWANTIGAILSFVGVRGFLGNLDAMYDHADDESSQWEAFLEQWSSFSDTPVTVATLGEQLRRENSALRDVLPDDLAEAFAGAPAGFQRRLGKALAKRAGTRYGEEGLHLVRAGQDAHARGVRWRVLRSKRSNRSLEYTTTCGPPPTPLEGQGYRGTHIGATNGNSANSAYSANPDAEVALNDNHTLQACGTNTSVRGPDV